MKRAVVLLTAFASSITFNNFAWAQSPSASQDNTNSAPLRTDAKPDVTAPSIAPAAVTNSKSNNDSSVPKKTLGFIVGAAVGAPASVVRRTVAEEKYGVQGLIGDSNSKLAKISAGTFWLPFSLVLGALEGPVYGPANSLRNIKRPLTKDQMGLGDHLTSAFEKTEAKKPDIDKTNLEKLDNQK